MGRVAQQTIEQIAAANEIVDVIGGYFPLKRAGAVYKALCPFHQEKSPSFTVNPQRQIFKCFGCGAGGTVFKFVQLYENVDFPTAIKRPADRAGIQMVEEELTPDDDRRLRLRKRLLALHEAAAEWFHRNLLKTQAAQRARDYLKGRGISADVARAWKIGFAPDSFDAFTDFARGQNFTDEEIIRSGIVKVKGDEDLDIANPQSAIRNPQFYDRFRNRVMFPICNDLGEAVAFSGRVLAGDAQEAKYVNSPETMLFTKGNILFGLHKSKRALIDKKSAIVLEGQLDLITAFEAGVQNVIAPQGTAFTERQARILKRYVEEVVLCFDSDTAGQKAAERSLAALLDANLYVRIAEMPQGHDPDSLIRTEGAEAFTARIAAARDFFDHQIERHVRTPEFGTPRGKLQLARKMAEFIALLTDPVLRDTVINQVSARLQIPAGDLRLMAMPQRRERREEAEETGDAGVPARKPSKTISLLCLLALSDAAARDWLLAQDWRAAAAQDADGDLLAAVLEAEVVPGDTNSVNSLLAGLPAETEVAISQTLLDQVPPNPAAVAEECWHDLERRATRRRIEAITSRLRSPEISLDEVFVLQKEVLDLQRSLTDIARPFS